MQSPESLRKVTALRSIPLPEIFFENAPADLARVARETIATDEQIKDMLTGIYPSLELFGLDGTWPASKTDAIAKAVIVSTKIPAEYRMGLHLNQQIDVTAFTNLRDRWARLMSEEESWRERLSAYGRNAWPRPTDLGAAAETLRKSNFGKAFAAISGASKPARELVARLGLPERAGAGGRAYPAGRACQRDLCVRRR